MPSSKPTAGTGSKCPICGRPTHAEFQPFCSRRCADVDLSRWLRGSYAIPDRVDSEDGESTEPAADSEGGDGRREH